MLEIINLESGYNKINILKNISMICEKGEITTIIGPNGSGKSTLLKSILGLTNITSGEILFDKKSLLSLTQKEKAQKLSYLSQGKIYSDTTVLNTVLFGRFPYLSFPRKYKKTDFEKARKSIKKMGIESLENAPVSSLSEGTKQKVMIAMALCQETDVILLDEPTTYLDVKQQFNFSDILIELSSYSKTIINVTHDIPLALKISNKIAVMKNGSLVEFGSPKEILSSKIIPTVYGIDIKSIETEQGTEYFFKR